MTNSGFPFSVIIAYSIFDRLWRYLQAANAAKIDKLVNR